MGNSDSALREKIEKVKKQRNALILAHNYQLDEVQDIADLVGDTLELGFEARRSKAEAIVVCGVHFVAETVSIFSPDKTILIPNVNANCPMAEMITAERLREKKKEFPGASVVCYIKSPAEVKAESDICCTSENAVRIVEKLKGAKQILFVPDQYLGDYVCTQIERDMELWPGYCPSHFKINVEDIVKLKEEHSQAKVVVHPDCTPQVRALADRVLNTGGIIKFARQTEAEEVVVGAEVGIIHRLSKENPGKRFIPASERAVCGKMKLITLENILWSLENLTYQIKIPEDTRLKAKMAIDRMLEFEGIKE